MLHRRFIACRQLAVEVTRIPFDQHAAQVEDRDASTVGRLHVRESGQAETRSRSG